MRRESLEQKCSSVLEKCDLEMKRGAMKKKVGGPVDKFNLIDNFALASFCKWDRC